MRITFVLAVSIAALPAFAQPVLQPPITVTATRRAQSVDDTLATVTVISRADIERSQAPDLVALLRGLPGIDISRTGGDGHQTSVFVRGTNANQSLVLIDGIRVASAITGAFAFENLPLAQIDRIEIVRGPRASWYGSDAIGGVIQIFTRDPRAASAQFSIGRWQRYQGSASWGLGDEDSGLGVTVGGMSVEGFSAQTPAGFAYDPDRDGHLNPQISRDRRGEEASGEVPQSIARMAVDDKVAVLSDDAGEDQRFTGQSVVLQKIRSAMCVPLIGSENKSLGVIYVDNFSLKRFGETDLDFLIAFAGIASVALENGQFAERIKVEALARSNFERFFTPHLAARIASSPDAVKLGGDKRRVAVLFSDIRGFTALSETMNAETMARLLTEYFTEMVECVFRHGGTLDKFIGDAVMAQWGAPIGEEDDCDRAMSAAIDMMDELERLNARWKTEGRPVIGIGIGLNVGDVFAGNIGSDRRLEYTVIGDPVNVSSRLCGAAAPGEILVSDYFRSSLRSPPPLEALPPMELKGKSQALPVFRVKR